MRLKLACVFILSGFMRFVWLLLKPIHSRCPYLRDAVSKAIRVSPFLQRIASRKYEGARYAAFEASADKLEILVDITHVYKNDLRTGIQRVVRSILAELESGLASAVEAIYLTDAGGFWHYRYVNRPDAKIVVPKRGDFFLGLDLNSNVIAAEAGGLFDDWKSRGARVSFVVYDILPLEHPEWWEPAVSVGHELWLRTILRLSDDVVCISKSVLDSVSAWASKAGCYAKNIPKLHWFHLGADVESSMPTQGFPSDALEVMNHLKHAKTFLLVGTIEPRKGYQQVLDAFENLWSEGRNVNLVIVGKKGWLVDKLIGRIRAHPELGKRLFWLEAISDEYLLEIYAASTCLVAASEGEGFGLPLIEAAKQRIPIIARDIPVFREVAEQHVFYFSNSHDPQVVTNAIVRWLDLEAKGQAPRSENMPWITWRESASQLLQSLGIKGNP